MQKTNRTKLPALWGGGGGVWHQEGGQHREAGVQPGLRAAPAVPGGLGEGESEQRRAGGSAGSPPGRRGALVSGGYWMLQREGRVGTSRRAQRLCAGRSPPGALWREAGAGGGQEGSVPECEPSRGCRPRAPVLISMPLWGGGEGNGPAGGPRLAWRGVAWWSSRRVRRQPWGASSRARGGAGGAGAV